MRLLYFSPVFWSSYAQRPHAMARHFLEQGGEEVLWVEPYPTRLPVVLDLLRRPGHHDQGTQLSPGLSLLRPKGLPIEPLPGGALINRYFFWRAARTRIFEFSARGRLLVGVGRPSKLALDALRELSPASSFYDAMDDFPEFYTGLSKGSMRRQESAIVGIVDVIYVSSQALMLKFARCDGTVVHLPNACELSPLAPQAPKKERRRDRIVIGYIGTIAAWFDWRLVAELAQALPQVEVRLIGPCFSTPPAAMPENVRLQESCRLEEVPAHLNAFTAGLIPFKICGLTASVDPIKYYEYHAMGLPILSTRFGDMARRGESEGVFFLDRGKDFSANLRQALEWRPHTEDILRFRRENNWRYRFSSARVFRNVGA